MGNARHCNRGDLTRDSTNVFKTTGFAAAIALIKREHTKHKGV